MSLMKFVRKGAVGSGKHPKTLFACSHLLGFLVTTLTEGTFVVLTV